jgi:hypothetical protein
MRRVEAKRLLAWLLIWGQVLLVGACHHTIDGIGASGASMAGNVVAGILGSNDLGLALYNLWQSQIQADPDPNARAAELAALSASKADFIAAVDVIANANTLQNSLGSVQSIFTLVDDGTIQLLASDVAQILQTLQGDPAAQTAIVQLAQQGVGTLPKIPLDDLIVLLGRLANYPDVQNLWTAWAQLIQQNPQLATQIVGLASTKLQALQPPTPGSTPSLGAFFPQLEAALLDPAQPSSSNPSWVVKLDDRGLPLVATDPATGTFFAPFTDDGTGHASVDASGDFLDASGNVIAIQPFGPASTAGYDASGRAIDTSGDLLFAYFDAKATILALGLALVGNLVQLGAHADALTAAEAILGPRNPDNSYQPGPLEDLAFGAMELLPPATLPPVLRAVSSALTNQPALAQSMLVSLGQALDKCRVASQASAQAGGLGGLSLDDPRMVQLTDTLFPLIDQVNQIPASGGASTTRVLLGVLQSLSTQAPGWPAQVGSLMTVHSLQPSVAVDYTHPATYTDGNGNTVDNRSAMQRILDLLAHAQTCTVPLSGQTLAELIVSLSADQTPQTVGTISTLVTQLPGFVLNIACPNIANDIPALNDLASSGALDAFLPIAKAFKDNGEIPLLVQILLLLDQNWAAIGRPNEQDLGLLLGSGSVDSLCTLLGQTTQITDPTTGATLSNLIADGMETFFDQHSSHVVDRNGNAVPSLAYLLLLPLRAIDARLRAANATANASAVMSDLAQVFLARTTGPAGQQVLSNAAVIPFVAQVLAILSGSVPTDDATRRADVTSVEQQLLPFLSSDTLGTLLLLARTCMNASSRPALDAALIAILTPNANAQNDIFGAAVKLIAISFQLFSTLPSSSIASIAGPACDLAHFLGAAIDPSQPVVQDLIVGITKVLTVDQGQTVLSVVRAAMNPPTPGASPPLSELIDIILSVESAGSSGTSGPLTQTGLDSLITEVLAFMQTPGSGLQAIFDAIKNRTK